MAEESLPGPEVEFTPRDDRDSRESLIKAGWRPGQRRKTRVLWRDGTTSGGFPVRTVIHLPKLR